MNLHKSYYFNVTSNSSSRALLKPVIRTEASNTVYPELFIIVSIFFLNLISIVEHWCRNKLQIKPRPSRKEKNISREEKAKKLFATFHRGPNSIKSHLNAKKNTKAVKNRRIRLCKHEFIYNFVEYICLSFYLFCKITVSILVRHI